MPLTDRKENCHRCEKKNRQTKTKKERRTEITIECKRVKFKSDMLVGLTVHKKI